MVPVSDYASLNIHETASLGPLTSEAPRSFACQTGSLFPAQFLAYAVP